MTEFITEIPRQTICIDGVYYTSGQLVSPDGKKESLLQQKYYAQYGKESFQASVADFLAEWFNERDRVCVHTSGSTGTPKEMWVEKQRMMNSACMTVNFLQLQPGDTAQLCMPVKYIAGKMVVVRALVAGLQLLLTPPCGHPLQHLSAIPVFSAMIPMQVYNSLQVPEEKERLMQIRHLIIGGGAVDESMAQVLRAFPHAVWSTYGMTETLSHIALRQLSGKDASEWYTPFETVRLSQSEEDTLVIEAPQVNPDILTTHDIVSFNHQGQFKVIGRKDNIINTGGIKVQIEQVEKALKPHIACPFLITSVPDAKFGERIVMLVETDDLQDKTGIYAALETAIASLPAYWRPKTMKMVSRLPLTETGKPDRANARKLAQQLAEEDSRHLN